MANELNLLSRRAGFNTALRHFRIVTRYVEDIQAGANLADLMDESLKSNEINRTQLEPIVSALLVDKFSYSFLSHNLRDTIDDVGAICGKLAEWGGIQLCLSYFHPQAGLFVINPKRAEAFEEALPLLREELVVVFAGAAEPDIERGLLDRAVRDCVALLDGVELPARPEYRGSRPASFEPAAPAPQPAPGAAPGGKRRMTPRYSVIVTNEVFHNGNVEAWKKIIESYKANYPALDVLIWYENERINDINALFKWGKVKHGNPIMMSVVGDDIRDVSKLQRYLFEGASPRFEVFLRGGVDRVLDLF